MSRVKGQRLRATGAAAAVYSFYQVYRYITFLIKVFSSTGSSGHKHMHACQIKDHTLYNYTVTLLKRNKKETKVEGKVSEQNQRPSEA